LTQRDQLERRLHRLSTDVVFGAGTRARLIDRLAGEDAEGDGDRERHRELSERSRDGMREDIEMRGLASDQTAKRNDRIETTRSPERRDRRRQLERPGDLELLDRRAGCERGLYRALGERAGDLVVPARAHDRDARSPVRILHPGRSLPSARHLPQSSPRMQDCSVSA